MLGKTLKKSTGKSDAYFQAKQEGKLDAQCMLIATVNESDDFQLAINDILTSTNPNLWHSLISNGFIRVMISRAQFITSYNATLPLIAATATDPELQSLWIVNSLLFYRQVDPINYKNHFKRCPAYFPALYAYGAQFLQNHCFQSTFETRSDFNLWMDILLSLSDQPAIFERLRANNHFNTFFALYTLYLGAPLKLLALNVFPEHLGEVLDKIKVDLAVGTDDVKRQARSLLNLMFKTDRYKANIQMDADFCKVLGVAPLVCDSTPLKPQRTPPTPPQRYESSIAATTADSALPERPSNPVASVFDAQATFTTAYNAFEDIDESYVQARLQALELGQTTSTDTLKSPAPKISQ